MAHSCARVWLQRGGQQAEGRVHEEAERDADRNAFDLLANDTYEQRAMEMSRIVRGEPFCDAFSAESRC